jgi:hypothetical protein
LQSSEVDRLSIRLAEALRAAYGVGLGVPPGLEPIVREFARAWREAGGGVEGLLVEVKRLVREATASHEPVFTPKVVGWSIAGFFDGSSPKQ